MSENDELDGGQDWPAVERRKTGWAVDWQSSVERDKETLARSLHDNTGGLLVAAVMDIAWVESHLHGQTEVLEERLARARSVLEVAIDLNRKMIEDLRPTLLDNFGPIAALKWHFAEACKSANILCTQQWPDPSPEFTPAAAIALYRIGQTLLAIMVSHHARAIRVALTVEQDVVELNARCEGMRHPFNREDDNIVDALASVTGRLKALGGEMVFEAPPGSAVIACRIPAEKAIIRQP